MLCLLLSVATLHSDLFENLMLSNCNNSLLSVLDVNICTAFSDVDGEMHADRNLPLFLEIAEWKFHPFYFKISCSLQNFTTDANNDNSMKSFFLCILPLMPRRLPLVAYVSEPSQSSVSILGF